MDDSLNHMQGVLKKLIIHLFILYCLTLLVSLPLLALRPIPPLPLSVSGSRASFFLSGPGKLPDLVPVPFPFSAGSFTTLHLSLSLCPQIPHSYHASISLPDTVTLSVSFRHEWGQPDLGSTWLGDELLLSFFLWLQDAFVKVKLEEAITC